MRYLRNTQFRLFFRAIFSMAVLGLGVLALMPARALATDDASISGVTVAMDSTEPSATGVDYDVVATTSAELSNLTCVFFPASSGNPVSTGFTWDSPVMNSVDSEIQSATLMTYDGSESGGGVAGVKFTFSTALSAGDHAFTLTGVTNSPDDGTFRIGCTSTAGQLSDGDYTFSEDFDIGEGGSSNSVSAVTWTTDSTVIGETANYTFSIVLDEALQVGNVIQLSAASETVDITETGISFENSTFASETLSGTYAPQSSATYTAALISLDAAVEAGTHEFTVSGAMNPSVAGEIHALVTTNPQDSETLVTTLTPVTFTEASAPDEPAEGPLDVVKKKKVKVTLQWGEVEGADSYVVQVRKCKMETKKKCQKDKHFQKKGKYKKFSDLTTTEKLVKNLKTDTFYGWRVKACNDVGCSDFTDWSRFRTKR